MSPIPEAFQRSMVLDPSYLSPTFAISNTMSTYSTNPGKPPFRFLELPPELRNEIYRLVMPNIIDIARIWRSRNLSLLRTSSQANREFSAVLYAGSIFYIDLTVAGNYAKFLEWIYSLSGEVVSRIMRLSVKSTIHASCHDERDAWFTIWSKPQSPGYTLGGGISRVCRKVRSCNYAHEDVDLSGLVTAGLFYSVETTRPGSLCASHVVRWVRIILYCAGIIL